MQARLKCDRVPKTRRFLRSALTHSSHRLPEKRPLLQQDGKELTMQPTADFNPSGLARSLLRRSRQGALATLMAGSGDPYCSLVNLASYPDGSPILLISRLAVHTKNILADGRVSLMLDERSAGDPLEGARIMLSGRAEEAGDEKDLLKRRYLNAHPSAEAFVSFKDFAFFRIRPTGTHLVAGFGRIVDLKAPQFLTDISDAG